GNVVDEIKYLIDEYGIDSLLILDETFTINKKRVSEFCKQIKKEKIDIPWSCYARVNLVDQPMLNEMKSSGCYRVGYGIESGSQRILNQMDKKVTVEQAKEAIRMTREAGLICGTTWMFGYLGENISSIQETINFCKEMLISPSFFYTTPYPGNNLYEKVKNKIIEKYGDEEKFISVLGDASDFTINLTDFSDEELHRLKKETEEKLRKIPLRRYPEYIYRVYQQYGLNIFIKRVLNKMK
ncbi:MAG: radical SAM protein, partial [Bacteroidetes bacterium]|nr:radical SAM protein [Bacteroidota bacterium]